MPPRLRHVDRAALVLSSRGPRRFLALFLSVLQRQFVLAVPFASRARADSREVEDARTAYNQALWLKVVELLQPAVDGGTLTGSDRTTALELLARAQVRL